MRVFSSFGKNLAVLGWLGIALGAAGGDPDFGKELRLPKVGDCRLRVISPTVLELGLVTAKEEGKALERWNFADRMPPAREFLVSVDGRKVPVAEIGFRRRPVYAPEGRWDLRVGNWIYLVLGEEISEGAAVSVTNPSAELWGDGEIFESEARQDRLGVAIHANQVGYETGYLKEAVVGYFLGTLGELEVDSEVGFYLKDQRTGRRVFVGELEAKRDFGLPWEQYQRTLVADFTGFDEEGVYRLGVEGLGESYPFRIGPGMFATLARTYALGMYHQRSGMTLVAPYTNYPHPGGHLAAPRVATEEDEVTNGFVEKMSEGAMKGVAGSRFPAVKKGRVPATGGHHDAGDFSKYTSNSALLVNALIFGVDAMPGVASVDNLGLPESGDGIPDLLQLAKWEADFLAQMQDDDGGFFFLVYPEGRKYESGTPDQGDPQVLFPKNTAVTGSGTAALAQMASSPHFKKHYPKEAARYLEQAKKGWVFLEKAWERYGFPGAYQRISHYGHRFESRDEVVWAAVELYLATGEQKYAAFLKEHWDPVGEDTRMWGWLRMVEGWGAAARSYATAVSSGRVEVGVLDPYLFKASQREVLARGDDLVKWSDACAYGTSLSMASKRWGTAGWHFASELAFDLGAADAVVGRKEKYRDALIRNVHYELGVNPVNVCYVTGLGWKRQHEIVHQWAQATPNSLPMTGIPLGSAQVGFGYISPYKKELGKQGVPSDGNKEAPYAFFDRWADNFNVSTEFVTFSLGRCLAMSAMMMAETGMAEERWAAVPLEIKGVPAEVKVGEEFEVSVEVASGGRKIEDGVVVWEALKVSPNIGLRYAVNMSKAGNGWVMVEVQWPDGVRAFGRRDFLVTSATASMPRAADAGTVLLLNGDTGKAGSPLTGESKVAGVPMEGIGRPLLSTENLGWMLEKSGTAVRLGGVEDALRFRIGEGDGVASGVFSAWVFVEEFPYGIDTCDILSLRSKEAREPEVSLHMDKWKKPGVPDLRRGGVVVLGREKVDEILEFRDWQFWEIRFGIDGVGLKVNGREVPVEQGGKSGGEVMTLEIGHFKGLVDELRLDRDEQGGSR